MQPSLPFKEYGQIVWLWSNSDLHKSWPIHLQSRFILPALVLQQYHIIERDSLPVAYCSWAFLSKNAEKELLIDPSNLDPKEWKSGDRLWFIDCISPFSPKYTWQLRSQLSQIFPKYVARAIRVKKECKKARVVSFKGMDLKAQQSRLIKDRYLCEMRDAILHDHRASKQFHVTVK